MNFHDFKALLSLSQTLPLRARSRHSTVQSSSLTQIKTLRSCNSPNPTHQSHRYGFLRRKSAKQTIRFVDQRKGRFKFSDPLFLSINPSILFPQLFLIEINQQIHPTNCEWKITLSKVFTTGFTNSLEN
jgi:hypothetical protein